MQDIQEIFSRIQANKKQLKDLNTSYKDALKNSQEYQELQEQAKTIREKMKTIKMAINDQFASELTQIEDLKIDIASDLELASDIAMSTLMKGETVEVRDEYDNEYEPIFKVTFKKAN